MKKLKPIILSAWALISTSTVALAIDVPPIEPVGGTLAEVIENIGVWAMGIAGAIAVIFLIWGGIIYITGGEKGAESGKKVIVNAIIGLAIIALAGLIARTVLIAIGA